MIRAPRQRAAKTNGSRVFLERVPGTSEHARRYRDLIEQAEAERGGHDALSATAQVAVTIWAGLVVELEVMHSALGRGERIDPEALGQLGDRIDRAARRMGPVDAKAVTPDLRNYLSARGQK